MGNNSNTLISIRNSFWLIRCSRRLKTGKKRRKSWNKTKKIRREKKRKRKRTRNEEGVTVEVIVEVLVRVGVDLMTRCKDRGQGQDRDQIRLRLIRKWNQKMMSKEIMIWISLERWEVTTGLTDHHDIKTITETDLMKVDTETMIKRGEDATRVVNLINVNETLLIILVLHL